MKILIKILIVITVYAFGSADVMYAQAKQQSGFESHLSSTDWNINLHGPVKTARMFYTYVNPNLKSYERGYVTLHNEIRNDRYLKFNIQGLLIESGGITDSITEPLKEKYLTRYFYDHSDIKTKAKYRVKKRNRYPIRESALLIQANQLSRSSRHNYLQKFNYIFHDSIIMKMEYSLLNDTIMSDSQSPDHLRYTISYLYDKQQRVNRQNVIASAFDLERAAQPFAGSLSFLCFDTEVGYCEDTGISYEYDVQDRLTKVTLTGCGRIAEEEKYTYAVGEDYIEKLERKIDGQHGFPTGNMTAYYNKFGDIIEMQFKANSELAKPWDPRGPRYYEYTYDSHNNWTQCRMYLMGNKDEPTIIATRLIEYY